MEFFAFLRALEASGGREGGWPRFAEAGVPADEPARLCQAEETLLVFHSCAIQRLEPATRTGPMRLFVNCFGMLGPHGPMPQAVSELLRTRARQHTDAAPLRFLDLFNHRMMMLMYRAWAAGQPATALDRERGGETSDWLAWMLRQLSGLGPGQRRTAAGTYAFRDRAFAPLGQTTPLHYSGWLAGRCRSAEGLASILADYFELPAQVGEFVARRIDLPEGDVARLGGGQGALTLGYSARVAALGRSVWDCQSTFGVTLGPMSLAQYESLLPVSRLRGQSARDDASGQEIASGAERLGAWMRLYVGEDLGWQATLKLAGDQVPKARLGKAGRLGWSAWLPERVKRDRADVVLHSHWWEQRGSG